MADFDLVTVVQRLPNGEVDCHYSSIFEDLRFKNNTNTQYDI